jgi:hypothetical protein
LGGWTGGVLDFSDLYELREKPANATNAAKQPGPYVQKSRKSGGCGLLRFFRELTGKEMMA